MSEAWKQLDLEGGGLQAANVRLAGLLKRRTTAYRLLAAFPLGLHRAYLEESRGAWAYRLLTLAAIGALALGFSYAALGILVGLLAWCAYDLTWIDTRVAQINKALRMQVYLKHGPGAPSGYRGRFSDDGMEDYRRQKEQERPGHPPPDAPPSGGERSRAPSFAEQEAKLRELAKRRKPPVSKS